MSDPTTHPGALAPLDTTSQSLAVSDPTNIYISLETGTCAHCERELPACRGGRDGAPLAAQDLRGGAAAAAPPRPCRRPRNRGAQHREEREHVPAAPESMGICLTTEPLQRLVDGVLAIADSRYQSIFLGRSPEAVEFLRKVGGSAASMETWPHRDQVTVRVRGVIITACQGADETETITWYIQGARREAGQRKVIRYGTTEGQRRRDRDNLESYWLGRWANEGVRFVNASASKPADWPDDIAAANAAAGGAS